MNWILKIANCLSTFGALLLYQSCQTVKPISPLLPTAIDKMFSTCRAMDGGVYLSIYRGPAYLFSSQLDWVAGVNGTWSAEAYSAFGQTIGRIDANSSLPDLKLSFSKSSDFGLGVESDGQLTLDGIYIGMSLGEVPCFMKGLLPEAWKTGLTEFRQDKDSAVLEFNHNSRSIKVVVNQLNQKDQGFCTFIEWSQFLGLLRHQYELCHLGTSPSSGFLEFDNGVKVKWVENPSV